MLTATPSGHGGRPDGAGGSVAPLMPELRPVTVVSPRPELLARLRLTAWPKTDTARRLARETARALADGTWEALWAWAWAALAQLHVPGVTAPEDGPLARGTVLMERTRAALEALEERARPAGPWVAELIGYSAEGIAQAMDAQSWPRRGRGRTAGVAVTVLPPVADLAAPPPTPEAPAPAASESPDGVTPPKAILTAAGLTAWPADRDARRAATEVLRVRTPAKYLDLVRWAVGGGRERGEAAVVLGYSHTHLTRVLAREESLADLVREPGRALGAKVVQKPRAKKADA